MSLQNKNKMILSYKLPFNKTNEESWSEVISKIETRKQTVEIKAIKTNLKFYYTAASIMIFLSFSFFIFNNSYQNIYVENGMVQEVVLPDSSIIIINSDSYMFYSKLTWAFSRKVKLNGEAYFKVKSGNKFIVTTPIAKIQVVGTEFNTYSRNEFFEIKCFSGQVKIKNSKNGIVLTKGNAYKINKKIKTNSQFNFNNNNEDWRNGMFYYKKQNLQFVFNEFSRQFNVKVILPKSLQLRLFTGYFSNQNLEETLNTICLPMQLNYKTKDNKTITIYEK